jgi:predicted transcriptional regulator
LSVSLLEKLQMSSRQYYNALHRLKTVGLLEKRDGIYHHTTLGSVLYKQVLQQIGQLSKYQKELKMIDHLKKIGQFSDEEIKKFVTKVTNDYNLLPMLGGASNNTITNVVNSYENMIKVIRERIEVATNEILIATRVSPDEVIALLIERIKVGVNVRVLVDERLIAEYRRVYYPSMQNSDSPARVDNHDEERMKVVENPWYQSGVKIERRVGKVPFGLIIIDRNEVGVELVDSYNPDKFSAGILVKDNSQIGDAMLRLYDGMWSNSHSVDMMEVVTK